MPISVHHLWPIAIAAPSLGPIAIAPGRAVAEPVTYDFTVTVSAGALEGQSFRGSFSYDDDAIEGVGTETLDSGDGLEVRMDFRGNDYRETDDVRYPDYPQLRFADGEIEQLDFWAEPTEPQVWWTLPGWTVELERRES